MTEEPKVNKKVPKIELKKSHNESCSSNVLASSSEVDDEPGSERNAIPDIKFHGADTTHFDNFEIARKNIRSKVPWSADEMKALLDGVDKYGEHNWSLIISENKNVFDSNRRIVDLVHKYRQHTKASSFYKTPKKNWIEIDDDGEVKTDAMGEIISYTEKFPYDAAMKFAKRKDFEGYKTFKLIIRESEDITNIHAYRVTVNSEKIKLKKLTLKE